MILAAPLGVWAVDTVYTYKPDEGLVPCGTSANPAPCSICHLYVLIQRILGFLMFTVAPVVAVLAISIAGFRILISGDNPGQRSEGYKIIKTTITGLVIMFAGWVLINEALFFFTQTSGTANSSNPTRLMFLKSPWNSIQCVKPSDTIPK